VMQQVCGKQTACLRVCVYMCKRERERERERAQQVCVFKQGVFVRVKEGEGGRGRD